MEVKIGVVYTAKELVVEVDGSPDDVAGRVESALSGPGGVLWITDKKGRRVGVPADKVAYVELSSEDEERRVGFARP